jgi:hypothetical protein
MRKAGISQKTVQRRLGKHLHRMHCTKHTRASSWCIVFSRKTRTVFFPTVIPCWSCPEHLPGGAGTPHKISIYHLLTLQPAIHGFDDWQYGFDKQPRKSACPPPPQNVSNGTHNPLNQLVMDFFYSFQYWHQTCLISSVKFHCSLTSFSIP